MHDHCNICNTLLGSLFECVTLNFMQIHVDINCITLMFSYCISLVSLSSCNHACKRVTM